MFINGCVFVADKLNNIIVLDFFIPKSSFYIKFLRCKVHNTILRIFSEMVTNTKYVVLFSPKIMV